MSKKSDEVSKEFTWSIEKIFKNLKDFEKSLENLKKSNLIKSLLALKGTLSKKTNLLNAMDLFFKIYRKIEKIYTFAHLLHDQNLKKTTAKQAFLKINSFYYDFLAKTFWIEFEILQLNKEFLKKCILDNDFEEFAFFLKTILRKQKHTLSEKEEEMLSKIQKNLEIPHRVFSSLDNADLTFENVLDKNNKSHKLSHAKYLCFLKKGDRVLRKNTFKTLLASYKKFENTFSDLLYGLLQNHVFIAKEKKFKSSLECALHPKKIDTQVYLNLLEVVKENKKTFTNYFLLKNQFLKIKDFYHYDFFAPFYEKDLMKINVQKSRELVLESVKFLGDEYYKKLEKGLFEDRWVDFYEADGKRSGAYSSGSFDTFPYILMNFENDLNSTLTLAHEAGHSMHSLLSCENQLYQYSSYEIFLAEIASTFNELLLYDLLLEKSKNNREKITILSNLLEGILSTFYRQTFFADFELKIHTLVDNEIPMTAAVFKENYEEIYKKYYCTKNIKIDKDISIEWARIPHFYYDFYVYQYATGISIAICFFEKIKSNKMKKEKYLDLLKSGGSDYPINLLKKAGVDITKKETIFATVKFFEKKMKKLKELLKND